MIGGSVPSLAFYSGWGAGRSREEKGSTHYTKKNNSYCLSTDGYLRMESKEGAEGNWSEDRPEEERC